MLHCGNTEMNRMNPVESNPDKYVLEILPVITTAADDNLTLPSLCHKQVLTPTTALM